MSRYIIRRYAGGRDTEIADLVLGIQNNEYALGLTLADQPDLSDIASYYEDGGFWTAEHDGRIVGTIGLATYDRAGALKKFFVAAEYRGSAGPAAALYDALIAEARSLGLRELFLDTPATATRSHRFYRRVGFEDMPRADLPEGYSFPDRDSLVLRLRLED